MSTEHLDIRKSRKLGGAGQEKGVSQSLHRFMPLDLSTT